VDLRTIGNYVPIRKQHIGFFFYAVEVKGKFNLEQAMKTQRKSECVALTARYELSL
jgi:hypothetical protein